VGEVIDWMGVVLDWVYVMSGWVGVVLNLRLACLDYEVCNY
jgi:hypothetical protein